jgi:hypothetical protein
MKQIQSREIAHYFSAVQPDRNALACSYAYGAELAGVPQYGSGRNRSDKHHPNKL